MTYDELKFNLWKDEPVMLQYGGLSILSHGGWDKFPSESGMRIVLMETSGLNGFSNFSPEDVREMDFDYFLRSVE